MELPQLLIPDETIKFKMLGCATVGYSIQFTNIVSLKYVPANVQSMAANTLIIVFSFLFTLVLFSSEADYNALKVFGSFLVVPSAVLLSRIRSSTCLTEPGTGFVWPARPGLSVRGC